MALRIFAMAVVSFVTVDAKTIVLIGDSMAEYGKQSVDKYCGGAQSTNRGVGGTTAKQVELGFLVLSRFRFLFIRKKISHVQVNYGQIVNLNCFCDHTYILLQLSDILGMLHNAHTHTHTHTHN